MLETGTILEGRYEIREKIGDGGYGTVYLAQDTRFSGNNFVAIKQLLPQIEQNNTSFRREADLLYNLKHPNLPNVSNCFHENNLNFIVMDYISGEDLAVSLKKGRRFTAAEVYKLADTVLDALEYLHSFTIFHRDIKPHNIKVDSNGNIFLLDFGTAKGTFDEVTVMAQSGQSVTGFTPFYAPLEQALRVDVNSYVLLHALDSQRTEDFLQKKTDARSDVYSLGITLYQLLTRIPPEKATAAIRAYSLWSGKSDVLQPICSINPEVPDNLEKVIHKSIALDPQNRFQSARDFRTALRDIQAEYLTSHAHSQPTIKLDFPRHQIVPPTIGFNIEDDLMKPSAASEAGKISPDLPKRKSRLPIYIGAMLAVFILLIGFGYFLARNLAIEPPGKTDMRSLSYSLLVQKMREGKEYQQPFESSGQEIFESSYKFQMNITPPENGFLYIFSEGLNDGNEKVFSIIFPTPKQNGGAANVNAKQQYQTSWNEFRGLPGTENFWLMWSKDMPEIAESARADCFQNGGVLSNKDLAAKLKNYLESRKILKSSVKDADKKASGIEFEGDSAIYLIQLEHR